MQRQRKDTGGRWPSGSQGQRLQEKETKHVSTLILAFQPPDPWENEFLLFQPPTLSYFAMAALANKYKGEAEECCFTEGRVKDSSGNAELDGFCAVCTFWGGSDWRLMSGQQLKWRGDASALESGAMKFKSQSVTKLQCNLQASCLNSWVSPSTINGTNAYI